MTRTEIANGVFFSEIEGDYKKSRLGIYLNAPLDRRTITSTALIPLLLERGTESCPDMTQLKRRLNALYGAYMSASYSCVGFSRVIDAYIEGVDDALVAQPGLSAERAGLLLDLLFRPALEGGAFRGDWLDVEREKLRDDIRSIVNDKRDYCLYLLADGFYTDERGLPTDGFEEDLDGITAQRLYADYAAFIAGCTAEIIYVGKKKEGLRERLAAAFELPGRSPRAAKPLSPVAFSDENAIDRPMAVEQDKLALAFTPGELLGERELAALRLGSALLGGSATSRLFMNVREKMSLCYYASSRVSYRAGGGLTIDCGIEHGNAEKARAAILRELGGLAQNGPTAKELEEIKLLFENLLGSVADTSGGLAGYCYNSIARSGRLILPQEELALLRSIRAEEIAGVLQKLHLNTSCLIEKEAAE